MNSKCKIIFTGDLLPADREHTLGVGVGTKIGRKEPLWCNQLKEFFRGGDITVVNLEGPIVVNAGTSDKQSFVGNSRFLDYLFELGITHAHVANNHILEHGPQAFRDTLAVLKRAGIETIGELVDNRPRVAISQCNGLIIGLAGYNAIHDIANPGCYAKLSEQSVANILRSQEMEKADIRILVLHWGNEYIHIPSWDQIHFARNAIDQGAHLVVGHHPHVIQPFEEYNNGLICYSLGNFLFDMIWSRSVRTGAILECEVMKNGIDFWHANACRYDASYFVTLTSSAWLKSRLRASTLQMKALEIKGEAYYKKMYSKQLKHQRFFNRILMKKQLFQQLPRMSRKQRMQIIGSLFSKVLKT